MQKKTQRYNAPLRNLDVTTNSGIAAMKLHKTSALLLFLRTKPGSYVFDKYRKFYLN